MKFLGMGGFEFVIILIVVLLIFGPKNLPKLGKAFGKTVSNLREGINEGKKKDDGETDENVADAEAAEPAKAAPAEIEGVVESIEEPAGQQDEIIDGAEQAAADAQAVVDEAFQPKKVRRVVKKKVE